MRAFLWRRCAPFLAMAAVIAVSASVASAAKKAARSEGDGTKTVEFFAAIEEGTIDARLIPRNSKKATVWVENKTDKPLSICMPVAFAGIPVLAQLFPDPGGAPRGGAPQGIAAPGDGFPAMDFFGGPAGGPGGGPAGGPFGGPGIFSLPAGKTIKARVPCVCLEHGKPDPKPRVPYKIVPIESVNDKPELAELVAALGSGRYSQRVVQVAAWHLANDMTWEQLDGLRIKHLNGRQERWFHAAEIEAAMKLVQRLPSIKAKAKRKKHDSLAQG